jgi:hypothetical protein
MRATKTVRTQNPDTAVAIAEKDFHDRVYVLVCGHSFTSTAAHLQPIKTALDAN